MHYAIARHSALRYVERRRIAFAISLRSSGVLL